MGGHGGQPGGQVRFHHGRGAEDKPGDRFLGPWAHRDGGGGESRASKRIKSQFSGELNSALHILDTGEGMGGERGEVAELFNKALKEMRGEVLPLSFLRNLFGIKVDTDSQCSTLVCGSRSMQRMSSWSSSAAVQAHLAEVVIPSKMLDKSYMQEQAMLGEEVLGFEFVKCGVEFSELESRGFISNTFVKPGQNHSQSGQTSPQSLVLFYCTCSIPDSAWSWRTRTISGSSCSTRLTPVPSSALWLCWSLISTACCLVWTQTPTRQDQESGGGDWISWRLMLSVLMEGFTQLPNVGYLISVIMFICKLFLFQVCLLRYQ